MQDFRLCKFFLIFYKFLMCPALRMTIYPAGMTGSRLSVMVSEAEPSAV